MVYVVPPWAVDLLIGLLSPTSKQALPTFDVASYASDRARVSRELKPGGGHVDHCNG